MVKVVIVNGIPGCGKSTFEQMCQDMCFPFTKQSGLLPGHNLAVQICSTIDFVKHVATICGWDGTKSLKNRKFLSDLKNLLVDWMDVPFKKIQETAETLNLKNSKIDWILFVDCREPEEIQKMKECLNATTLLIRRPGDENIETSNSSDANVFNYNYDLTVYNNSDIINLENEAKKFIEYIKKEEVPYYEPRND